MEVLAYVLRHDDSDDEFENFSISVSAFV